MKAALLLVLAAASALCGAKAQTAGKISELKGSAIGSQRASYAGGPEVAFDGDRSTFYGSKDGSNTWVGLDLGKKYVITRIAFASREEHAESMTLGVFEGANNPDFTDAIPIQMIKAAPRDNALTYALVRVSRGFRYVRYVGPNGAHCDVAELKFYGREGEGDDSRLYTPTNLPLVVVHTADAQPVVSKNEYLPGIASVISDGGKTLFSDSLGIRGRGNGSWTFPKKPYKIKLAHKAHLLDMPAKAKKWTLINNWSDKALMRNAVAFKISEKMGMDYAPACRFVDVMLNGEYQGTYQLCDQVEVKKHRVDITEMSPDDNSMPELAGGYLIEVDGYASQEPSAFVTTAYNLPVTIKYPDEDDITPQQFNYIKNAFNTLASRLAGNNYLSERIGFRKYLDSESFVKHILVSELCANADAYWSVFMYKDRNSAQFRTGPVWDFDLALNNDRRVHPLNDFVYNVEASSNAGNIKGFVARVMDAEKELAAQVWSRARMERGLDMNYINAIIDSMKSELMESQKLNFVRWPIMNTLVQFEFQCAGSYEAEVEVVRDFLASRMAWMDSHIGLVPVGIASPTQEVELQPAVTIAEGGVSLSAVPAGSVVEAYDMAGMKVARAEASGAGRVELSLAKGVYILKITNGKYTTVRKVAVRR